MSTHPTSLGAACVGLRVVVRYRLRGETGPSGGPAMTDVLGVMRRWDGHRTVLEREDGSLVEVALADVVSGKPVPPRPRRFQRLSPVQVQDHLAPSLRGRSGAVLLGQVSQLRRDLPAGTPSREDDLPDLTPVERRGEVWLSWSGHPDFWLDQTSRAQALRYAGEIGAATLAVVCAADEVPALSAVGFFHHHDVPLAQGEPSDPDER